MKNIRAFCGSGIFLPKFTSNSNPGKFIKNVTKFQKFCFMKLKNIK